MHSKQTVRYICEQFPSGNCYFYKRELITQDSWDKPQSLMWSAPRPITRKTYELRRREGYKTEYIMKNKKPAKVFLFTR